MGRQLSAKDKAFQEKMMKERRNTDMWRSTCSIKDKEIAELKQRNIKLEQTIAELHKQIKEHFHMTPEQFDEHIHKDMRGIEAIEYLRAMTGRLGGMY
jgi:hypothetical protein